jgi:type IV pilus assembly protein PilN
MIRINLLGLPRQKKGKRGSVAAVAEPGMPGEGPNILIFVVAGLLIGAGVLYFLYNGANNKSVQIAKDLATANQEGARLTTVKAKYEQEKTEADAFEKRVKVIDQLRAEQAGPVRLLSTIGDSVNNTEAVWLSDMTEKGDSLNIDGTALSTVAVANLITTLKRTDYFKSVEIKSAAQDPQSKEMTAFQFTLVCEKKPVKS